MSEPSALVCEIVSCPFLDSFESRYCDGTEVSCEGCLGTGDGRRVVWETATPCIELLNEDGSTWCWVPVSEEVDE